MGRIYPKKIDERFLNAKFTGISVDQNAEGTWSNFICGATIRFSLRIDDATKTVKEARFKTSGCGFVIATADFLCEQISEKALINLCGLRGLEESAKKVLGEFPDGRGHCFNLCFDGLEHAFAEYRLARIEQWNGEEALVCTCFGVTEGAIETAIEKEHLNSVDEVGEKCRAGTGCGSCQPIIQEILDSR